MNIVSHSIAGCTNTRFREQVGRVVGRRLIGDATVYSTPPTTQNPWTFLSSVRNIHGCRIEAPLPLQVVQRGTHGYVAMEWNWSSFVVHCVPVRLDFLLWGFASNFVNRLSSERGGINPNAADDRVSQFAVIPPRKATDLNRRCALYTCTVQYF